MSFLSLGLNIEEPQSLEESQKSPKELSDGILSANGQASVVTQEAQEGTPVSSNQKKKKKKPNFQKKKSQKAPETAPPKKLTPIPSSPKKIIGQRWACRSSS